MQEPRRTLDEYQANEMAIPEARLVQKTGGDWAKELGAKPGQFHNTITDEISDELNIVVVDILEGRARWGQEISSSPPICFSLEARKNISANGDDCSRCEYRLDMPWGIEAMERRKRCCLNFTILGIDIDHDNIPLIIRAHGVSAKAARELITQLRLNSALRGDYHRAIINIKSQERDTPYGLTYAIRPKIIRLITDERKAAELKEQSIRLLGAPIPLPEGMPEEFEQELIPEPQTEIKAEETTTRPLAEETLKGKKPLDLDLDI